MKDKAGKLNKTGHDDGEKEQQRTNGEGKGEGREMRGQVCKQNNMSRALITGAKI